MSVAQLRERLDAVRLPNGVVWLTPSELAQLLALADAAVSVKAWEQAGGDDWWMAHDALYRALDPLLQP